MRIPGFIPTSTHLSTHLSSMYYEESLVSSSHHDIRTTPIMHSPGSPVHVFHSDHATSFPANRWWSSGSSSFVRSQHRSDHKQPRGLTKYEEPDIDSPFLESLPMDFAVMPYSLPMASQSGLHPKCEEWSSHPAAPLSENLSLPKSPEWLPLSIGPLDSKSWDAMTTMTALDGNTDSPVYSPHTVFRGLLPCPSPPPAASPSESQSPVSAGSPQLSRHRDDIPPGGKMCSHCNATSTPLWRRDPATHRVLCNACGLYLQQRKKMRPAVLIAADQEEDSDVNVAPGAPECSHCHTHRTSVWRRSKSGAKLCNACGKLHSTPCRTLPDSEQVFTPVCVDASDRFRSSGIKFVRVASTLNHE
ncbi:hypothetical protein MSAN_00114200 [Mycena sanguinolenta]|uniref:GATA-type domain-containing protein n=1 Tax=Mycena sanguinolenta TaxID=230812 RepID=A0A8H6ZG96_9AGAR|nr:hypothetical protein MSAN_00114200 [Mycena sanguinolenta]